MTKKYLAAYFFLTTISLILDFVSFFSKIKSYGTVHTAFSDIIIIVASSLFLFINWYYVMFVVSLIYKFPGFVNFALMRGILGMMDSIHELIGQKLKNRKSTVDYRMKEDLSKYNYI